MRLEKKMKEISGINGTFSGEIIIITHHKQKQQSNHNWSSHEDFIRTMDTHTIIAFVNHVAWKEIGDIEDIVTIESTAEILERELIEQMEYQANKKPNPVFPETLIKKGYRPIPE